MSATDTMPTGVVRQCIDCGAAFVMGRYARYCDNCRWRHRGKVPKYTWTPEKDAILRERYDSHVKGRCAEIAAVLRMPRWVVKRRAAELGITKLTSNTRRPWTTEEEQFLWAYAGSRHVNWIARKLARPITSVVMKMKHSRIRRALVEGYTLRELELCFGIDHHGIDRWIRLGWLTGRKRGTDSRNDAWQFTDADLLRFILDHPMEFDLRRVNQRWFMDLITGGAVIRKELDALTREEASEERAA